MNPPQVTEILGPFRKHLLHTLLRIALVVSLPALAAGVYASVRADSVVLVVVDISAYLAFVLAYRLTRQRYKIAAYITVGTVLLMALTFLFMLGTEGATMVWLTAATLLAAILLERRDTMLVFSISCIAVVVATVLLMRELLPWSIAVYGWLSVATSFLGVAAFCAVAVRYLSERLAQGILNEQLLNQEVHHRVRNNLQMVESLLSIETSASQQEETRRTLLLMIDRISAISHTFDNLRIGTASLTVVTAGLLDGLAAAQQQRGRPPVAVDVTSVPETISLDDAVPLAVVLAELLSHCNVPHAQLVLSAESANNALRLAIRDRANFAVQSAVITPIQQEILEALASQFQGTVHLPEPPQHANEISLLLPISFLGGTADGRTVLKERIIPAV